MTTKRQYIWLNSILLCALALTSGIAHADPKYGFSDSIRPCALWDTFFPISFQVPSDVSIKNYSKPVFNIMYIAAGNFQHMNDFADLYKVGNSSDRVWPTNPYVISGDDSAICQDSGACVTKGYGAVGKGISAYKNLAAEFPNDNIVVLSDSPYYNGDAAWYYLPTRYVKLLRIELFTPYTGPVQYFSADYNEHVEPLYFEYRETGNKDELQLVASGGTVSSANFSGVKLPNKIRLTALSGVQIWLGTTSAADPWDRLIPYARTVDFTNSQMAIVPANCK